MRVAALALLLLLSSPARAAPVVDLYTMGPGDELFSAFGHAAICVTDGADSPATPALDADSRPPSARSRCYNYGTADFTTPVPLGWSFVRGRARFWVSITDVRHMLSYYAAVGRSVWRQRLTLSDDEAARVATALAASAEERVKYYRYHHFADNCTTRIRDVVDRATDGRLARDRVSRNRTFRQWARDGFAGDTALQAVVELVLGRSADRTTDSWSAMFLPSELRAEVARRFDAPPIVVVPGRPRPPPGATWLGRAAFVIAGALLALLLIAGARLGPRPRGLALVATALVLGLVGVILWALAALSSFPELVRNEALFAFWPTDLLLPFFGPRWLGRYLDARLVGLALMLLLHLGLFVQPLAPLLLALLPLIAARTVATQR